MKTAATWTAHLGIAAAAAGQVAVFEPLGVSGGSPPNVQPSSYARAVSADGRVVLGRSYEYEASHATVMPIAIVWRDGDWAIIPSTGYSQSGGLSHDGLVAAGTGPIQIPSGYIQPFYARLGAPTAFPPIPWGGASGLSGDGQTLVGFSLMVGAIAWTEARGMADLGHIPGWGEGTQSSASGASADGAVIVGTDYTAAGAAQAFLWTPAGGMIGLGFLDPANPDSRAYAVSEDGLTVVGRSRDAAGATRGFVWKAFDGMRALPLLTPGSGATAHDTSADGSVIVGEESMQGPPLSKAYYWDRVRGRRDLRLWLASMGATGLTGWSLTRATAVSPDGAWIVGEGIDPQGRNQAWRARIPAFCYANCDGSSAAPTLNINDFVCFQTRFAAGDPYANCDGSTVQPVLNVSDFICFQNQFAAGCP